jgi:signal transduction protein with GAF and PtsI domain
MEPSQIPEVNQIIRNISMHEAKELAHEVLKYSKVDDIKSTLIRFHDTHATDR